MQTSFAQISYSVDYKVVKQTCNFCKKDLTTEFPLKIYNLDGAEPANILAIEVAKFFQEYMIQIIKLRLTNKNASEYSIVIKSLLITCNKLGIFLNSNVILILSQLVILESLAYHTSHNGYIYLRTLSFMKKESFYMDKMSAYINKFYQLEYENERDEDVKLLYP